MRRAGHQNTELLVRIALLAVLIGLLLPAVKCARERFDPPARREVPEVLDEQAAAWNRGDLDGFMAGYWNDEGLRFFSGGTVTGGWQATLDRYRQRYQADGKEMGTLTFSELEVEPLGPDAALCRGRWGLVFAKSDDRPNGLFTLLLRKKAGGWKVVHDHTSAADPPKKN